MHNLIHLIYTSAATQEFSRSNLIELLDKARSYNQSLEVTGLLLYTKGSFFQILEGKANVVYELFKKIEQDPRHSQVTTILQETIPKRSFADWSMAFSEISEHDLNHIMGTHAFFQKEESFVQLNSQRTQKLLQAFKEGRWRTTLTHSPVPEPQSQSLVQESKPKMATPQTPVISLIQSDSLVSKPWYSYAFQPIVNAKTGEIRAYEALIRTLDDQSAYHVFKKVPKENLHQFDEESRLTALMLAAKLGLKTGLSLNFLPHSLDSSPTALSLTLKMAQNFNISPDQITIEVLEDEVIQDIQKFNDHINQYRGQGVSFSIDDFGAGYAGLNLLADFLPETIKIDRNLIASIHNNGPRQAIIHGIMRTCLDLGINVLAEGVETKDEFYWLRNQGIELFQGYLIAKPKFESLTTDITIPP